MFKKSILVLLAVIFLNSCQSNPVKTELNTDTQKLTELIDSLADYYKTQRNISEGGFFMSIVSPSQKFFVSKNVSPTIDESYHFRIASVTKTFTAAAIMVLYQEGKINIYDVITANMPGTTTPYIPESPEYDIPYKDQITIKLLLEHRAGVFDVTNQDIPASVMQPYAGRNYLDYVLGIPENQYHTFTFDELVGVVATNDLVNFPPDPNQYRYSNTGYSILGKIIERASGFSYSEFLRQYFFNPLQMTNTYSVFQGNNVQIPTPRIESYLYENGTVKWTTLENMSGNVAEGNLISCTRDINKWLTFLLTGRAGVSMANVELMKQVIPTGQNNGMYGLGLSYIDGLGFGHTGAHQSYLTLATYNPNNQISIVIGCNFWDFPDIFTQFDKMSKMGLKAIEIVQD